MVGYGDASDEQTYRGKISWRGSAQNEAPQPDQGGGGVLEAPSPAPAPASNILRLFEDGDPRPRAQPEAPAPEPAPDPAAYRPAPQNPPAPQLRQAQPASPFDVSQHPITKALEAFYDPNRGLTPTQIIADSINSRTVGYRQPDPYIPPVQKSPEPAPAGEEMPLWEVPVARGPVSDSPDHQSLRREIPIIEGRVPDADPAPANVPEVERPTPGYDAFWELWLGHQDYLRGQCIRMMAGNMADAEDALSNAMLRASQKFSTFSDGIVNQRAWLSKLVYNVCIDHYRREQRSELSLPEPEEGMQIVDTLFTDRQQSPEEIALCHEQLDRMHDCINQLSNNLRVPLFLRCVEGWSYPDIAKRLNLRTDTVRKRIQLARDQLRGADIR